MPKLTPFLWFEQHAEEAAAFYTSVFPNSKIIGKSPGPGGGVLTVSFELDGKPFVGLNGGPKYKFTEAVSFVIDCPTQDDVDYYWSKLSDGGQEQQCGWLKDKYGVSWQVIPDSLIELLNDPDPGRSQRAIQSMLKMRRIDIAEIRRASNG